ncbi:hypothetical protein H4R34_003648 [Dimargaris verticillata]|uniref:DUF1168-domain-containing protein n=1 Tax=Dimargaris verticillata TaxID=2761393 RepID=A0A9W8ECY7_9FUNG|nr:hypothetical protein H4R34_003648 [Dimargaris verticillata]
MPNSPPPGDTHATASPDTANPPKKPFVHVDQLSSVDRQRFELERLMKRADKPIRLPDAKKSSVKAPPEFVRTTMGSSAGAGSSDFHIYRAHRRHELARLKAMDEDACQEEAEREFERKRALAQQELDAKTAKRRAKRQRRKPNQKNPKK